MMGIWPRWLAGLVCGVLVALPSAGRAADYPDRPIHIVVGYGPGSPPDILTRVATSHFQELLGQPVIVENRPGASGTIALRSFLKQAPDGYTIGAFASATAAVLSLFPDTHVNLAKDVAAIGQVDWDYNVLVVSNKSRAHSLADLISQLKANPGKMNFGSGGYGSPAHLLGELLLKDTGTKAIHVPYGNFQSAIADVISNRVDFMIMGAAAAVPQIKNGSLRGLAVTSRKRLPALADTPTFVETGHPQVSTPAWLALIAQPGTPPAVIKRLNAALNKSLQMPAVRSALGNLLAEPAGGTPAEASKVMVGDAAKWKRVIAEAKIHIK